MALNIEALYWTKAILLYMAGDNTNRTRCELRAVPLSQLSPSRERKENRREK